MQNNGELLACSFISGKANSWYNWSNFWVVWFYLWCHARISLHDFEIGDFVPFIHLFYQPLSVRGWTSAFLLAVHGLCGVILSHFLPRWLRTGWQSVISQGKIPWDTPPWPGVEPGPRRGQTVSYHDWPLYPHQWLYHVPMSLAAMISRTEVHAILTASLSAVSLVIFFSVDKESEFSTEIGGTVKDWAEVEKCQRMVASAGLRYWGEAAAAAKNRPNWKKLGESVVETLCGTRHSA